MGRTFTLLEPPIGDGPLIIIIIMGLVDRRTIRGVSAVEARRKNVDVVLGPTINLLRSPLGGRQIVQVYASRPDSRIDRPVRWLVGWAVVRAASGEETVVKVPLGVRALAHGDSQWKIEPGEFTLAIGFSVDHLPKRATVSVPRTMTHPGHSPSLTVKVEFMSQANPPRTTRGPYAKTAQRQQEIIDAATNVFAVSGYHGGSLRDISRELGVSLTSLVHHFGTKSELLIAVLENADHTGADWLEARTLEAGVRTAMSELVVSNFSRPELLRLFTILSSEASAPNHPAHDWFVARYQRVTERITASIINDQSLGRIPSTVDATKAAKLLIAGWDGLQLQWLLDANEDMRDQVDLLLSRLFDAD